ncbi:MAG: AAA family ATPase [Vicinamibacterales bacterium]
MHHLNVRVAWHDNRWNGTVCRRPGQNAFCVDLDRVRAERDDAAEEKRAGRWFAELERSELPPCKAEGGAFMSSREWWRTFEHPYAEIPKASDTHGHLRPTRVKVPPFSSFAVPFLWMLRSSQERIDESLAEPLPADQDSPFHSPWVFGKERQEALCELFFGRLREKQSLVFFYTKSGHPLGDAMPRLVVGVGRITSIGRLQQYETEGRNRPYPMWDRLFSHSIRPDGDDGLLIPYHDYLESTGDASEDDRRLRLLQEIAVVPEQSHIKAFSFAGEHATADVALSTLVRCLEAVRLVKSHGVASGPWDAREEWLNAQIAKVWGERGAFPGAGAALEALGLRLGTSLMLDLVSSGQLKSLDDPWPALDGILKGKRQPPKPAYAADVKAVAKTWAALGDERRALLRLLSRFSLSAEQATRWFEPSERHKATRARVEDREILQNPYRIAETDLGDAYEHAVSVGVVDRGLLPDATIAARHPVEEPSRAESALDARRVRAAVVTVLRRAADDGDSLLAEREVLERLARLDLAHPCVVGEDWVAGHQDNLRGEVECFQLPVADADDNAVVRCMQLTDLRGRETKLASILRKRSQAALPSTGEDWKSLLGQALREQGVEGDVLGTQRSQSAIEEQAAALERITTRKLSVLVGRAGTGKTTVLGALVRSAKLSKQGLLFLAPTGKARVRITRKTSAEASTVAQFLYQRKRYDGRRQRPLFHDVKEPSQGARTVVIDECSMLTMDDLYAVLTALDLGHVQRIVLVGDPNQLPPIGVGRPFADLVAMLDEGETESSSGASSAALARLTVEVRTKEGAPSDALRLASWFTSVPQPVDADRVLSDLELGAAFNDLDIRFWKTTEDLYGQLDDCFRRHLGMADVGDVAQFNKALGLTPEGWVPYDDHDGAENFQLLSPIRLHPHGVHDLNRWIQKRYRQKQLADSRKPWNSLSLGDEEIVWGDKVILLKNGKRRGYDGKAKAKVEEYLANGEVGVAALAPQGYRHKFLNVAFAGRPDARFSFESWGGASDRPPLELAYVLTVHKAQGSDFGKVFVVLPKASRLMTKELIYTALTRSRDTLVLLIEGDDVGFLQGLAKKSETARRNTNLFREGLRSVAVDAGTADEARYASHLVHRTTAGYLVRSKSELAIANYLHSIGMLAYYERPLEGTAVPGRLKPDFSFVDDAGDVVLWEHLGMLSKDDYRRGWEWKKAWYAKNGFEEGRNLFTTSELDGLKMPEVVAVAERVKSALGS